MPTEPIALRYFRHAALVAGLLALAVPGLSRAEAMDDPPGADSESAFDYRTVPGDEIEIRVFEQDQLSRTFPVPTHGAISFPPIGTLEVEGRTVREIEGELVDRLAKSGYLANPRVSVVVKSYQKRYVYLLEGVQRPQAYELPVDRPLRLTQVLSLGGGLIEDSDRQNIKILRSVGADRLPTIIVIDIDEILEGGRIEKDIEIAPNDTIVVTNLKRDERQIFVGGVVKKPGAYPIHKKDELTVFRAVVLAGGFDKFASPSDTYLIRKSPDGEKAIRVDIKEIIRGGLKNDIPLEPNDIVWVSESFFGAG